MRRRGKPSLFQRLTGITSFQGDGEDHSGETYATDVYDDGAADFPAPEEPIDAYPQEEDAYWTTADDQGGGDDDEGHLPIDMHETSDGITIRTLVAGVSPDDLEITITREMVTIRGERQPKDSVTASNHYYQELYWGKFSRTIVLPEEVEVEESDATERHGLLTLHLPKVKKDRETKIRVRTG